MNKKEMIQEIKESLKLARKVLSDGFKGCWYLELEEGLHLVAANIVEDEQTIPVCKLAYNCDDLQGDYEYDWNMPTYINGETAYVELEIGPSDEEIEHNAEYLYKEAKAIINNMKKGLIDDWR